MTLSTMIRNAHESIQGLRHRMKTAKPYSRERMQARLEVHELYLTKLQMLKETTGGIKSLTINRR